MTKITVTFAALLTITTLCSAVAEKVSTTSSSTSSSTVTSTHHVADELLAALRQGNILPLTKILEIAATRAQGTVIKTRLRAASASATASASSEPGTAETSRKVSHRLLYEIDLLSKDGHKHELNIDARTGEILSN